LAFALSPGLAAAESGSQYEILLDRVKKADPTVDFKEFRIAYTKTSQYNPYEGDPAEQEMAKAFNNKDNPQAIECAEKILAHNYVNIRAHLICMMAYDMLGNKEKAGFHRYVSDGLIRSIIYPGGGKSPETAFTVISVDEEYAILYVFGLKNEQQALLHVQGHSYDELKVIDPKTNKRVALYFCIDIPWAWLQKYTQTLFGNVPR
jgi:hypothetical protein